MGLREEIQPYIQPDGLIRDNLRQGTKNGLCNLGLYYCTLVKRGESRTEQDLLDFEQVVRSCYSLGPDGKPILGSLRRSPTDGDLEEMDDYKSILSAAYLLKSKVAQEIYDYLEKEHFIVNWKDQGSMKENGKYNIHTMMWRDPSFIAHANFSVGKIPSPVLRLAWAVDIGTSGITNVSNQDARKLSWLLIQPMDQKCGLCSYAASKWKKRLYRDYPGGMRVVLGNYYADANHPIAKYFVD